MSSFSNTQQSNLLYFDLLITNVDTIYKAPTPVYFNETRTTPYLYCPEDYELSVVRFTLDTQTLPIIIPPIIPYSGLNNNYPTSGDPYGNPNKTIYSVSMTYKTYTAEEYIIFIPQDNTVSAPKYIYPNQPQNNSQGYYNITSYQYFVGLVNDTLDKCYISLAALYSAGTGSTLPSNFAPVMTWNNVNSTASVNVDVRGYSPFLTDPINVYFNPALAQLFSTFPYNITSTVSNSNVDAYRAYQLLFSYVAQQTELELVPFPFGSTSPQFQALQCIQETSTVSNWNPVVSIVFTSNTLPIIPTNVTQPLLFVDGAVQTGNNGNNNNINNVITDFSSDGPLKPYIYYVPTAEFRMISLVGNRPLSNIDIGVFYKTRSGDLVPFKLAAGGSASLKILFRRKDYK